MAYTIKDIRADLPVHKTKKPKQRKTADTIVVHCTASKNQDPFKLALYDITPSPENHISTSGCPTITYHDYIINNGTLFHCVDYTSITWHAGLYNTKSIGVVLAYEGLDNIYPATAQMQTLVEHLMRLCLYMHILPENVIGHREIPGMYTIIGEGSKKYKKKCPGLMINLDQLRQNITIYLQEKLMHLGLYEGPLDGMFGQNSRIALSKFFPKNPVNWEYNYLEF
jgi:N-acetyl-anhydromuramyl-L-alanine amidase AmpD